MPDAGCCVRCECVCVCVRWGEILHVNVKDSDGISSFGEVAELKNLN